MRAGELVDRLAKRSEGLAEFDRRHQLRVNLKFKMRQLGPDYGARDGGASLQVYNAVGYNGIGQPLHPDLAARLAMDLVLHMREGLVGDQDAAGRRLVLKFLSPASSTTLNAAGQ